MLDRWFRLAENGTRVRTELSAGLTTFLTMSYILFVQPALLAGEPAGMDAGAVTVATCLTTAVATAIMGLWARYPIALAPGMGVNAFFAYALIPAAAAAGHPVPWQAALGVVFASGVAFLALSGLGIREHVMDALSPSLKGAIAAGIGLFIAFIGMRNAGWIVDHPATLVALSADLSSPDVIVSSAGLLTAAVLSVRRTGGALLLGMLTATAVALALRTILPEETGGDSFARFQVAEAVFATPPSIRPTLLALDVGAILLPGLIPFVIVFLFVDLFDTVGTLVGVTEQAGLSPEGSLARAPQALATDALATTLGACLGTSTVTSYIESAAGVEQGGRTGLVALTVSGLFLLALFFSPIIAMVGSYPPITAPALILVGAAMLRNVGKIAWSDPSESIPAFLILVGIPLSFSIGDGMALGFLAYPLLKLGAGRGREVPVALWLLVPLLLAYFVLLRT